MILLIRDTYSKVLEVRGGSVLFEPGAIGGNFVGCFFVDDPDPVAVRRKGRIAAFVVCMCDDLL